MSVGSEEWRRLYQLTGGVIRPGGLALTERALAFCSFPPGATVLDVGCGPGATLEYLTRHGFAAVGVDPSAEWLLAASERAPQASLFRARGERLPLPGKTIDAVLTECSLSVMEDTNRALAEFRRVLKPNGKLMVSDIYLRRPEGVPALRCLSLTGCLAGARSRQELADQLETHGFRTLLWEDHSAALRQMSAELIMAGGSPEQFWCPASCAGVKTTTAEIRRTISAAQPGYFLLVAERRNLS